MSDPAKKESIVPDPKSATLTVSTAEIGCNDILLGRGAPITNNEGNQRLRQLVAERVSLYIQADKQFEKQQVAVDIVQEIRDRGGRFLRKVTSDETTAACESSSQSDIVSSQRPLAPQAWTLVENEKEIVTKVRQLLRDMAPESQSRRMVRRLYRYRKLGVKQKKDSKRSEGKAQDDSESMGDDESSESPNPMSQEEKTSTVSTSEGQSTGMASASGVPTGGVLPQPMSSIFATNQLGLTATHAPVAGIAAQHNLLAQGMLDPVMVQLLNPQQSISQQHLPQLTAPSWLSAREFGSDFPWTSFSYSPYMDLSNRSALHNHLASLQHSIFGRNRGAMPPMDNTLAALRMHNPYSNHFAHVPIVHLPEFTLPSTTSMLPSSEPNEQINPSVPVATSSSTQLLENLLARRQHSDSQQHAILNPYTMALNANVNANVSATPSSAGTADQSEQAATMESLLRRRNQNG